MSKKRADWKPNPFHHRGKNSMKARRRQRANERLSVRSISNQVISPHKQIAKLDSRLGIGIGARKERSRLSQLADKIKKAQNSP